MSSLLDGAVREVPPHPEEIAAAVHWVVQRTPESYDLARLDLGLTEVVTNALVHGVMELQAPFDREPSALARTLADRAANPEYGSRRIRLEYTRRRAALQLRVSWAGAAYHPEMQAPEPVPLDAVGGRGTRLISWCFDTVHWDDSGLAVTLILRALR